MFIKFPYLCYTTNLDRAKVSELYWDEITPPFKYLQISTDYLWKSFLKHLLGIGYYTMQFYYKILETSHDKAIYSLTPFQRYLYFFIYIFLFPKNTTKHNQLVFKLLLWYSLHNYKSWRHLFGHPVNGQRTWSNNKTRYRLPNILYNFLLYKFAKRYGIFTKTNLRISFLVEHINLLWYLEWYAEWLSANEIFAATKQKTQFFRLRINYRYLMNFQVSTPYSIEHKKKKKKRKKVKTEFTVGFQTLYVVSLFSKKKHLFKHLL